MLTNISVLMHLLGRGGVRYDNALASQIAGDFLLVTSLVSMVACITINAAHAEVASIYGGSDGLCGSRTANGERVNCSAMTAAHRTLPFGTRVTVCHHGCVVVRINDRGPFAPGRHIDLTPAAARAIGLTEIGHVSLSR
jgi:rare lipoprotein A (peptidoglycan hydrolase)